mgnify:CR=1 FL=1
MVSKGQLVTLQARVIDARDRGNIQLTVDDPENSRDARDNNFVLTARALELAMARVGADISPTPEPEPVPPVAEAPVTLPAAAEIAEPVKPKPRRGRQKAVEAP